MRSVKNFYGTKIQRDVNCVVQRPRRQKGALSVKVVNGGARATTLLFKLCNWSAITSR